MMDDGTSSIRQSPGHDIPPDEDRLFTYSETPTRQVQMVTNVTQDAQGQRHVEYENVRINTSYVTEPLDLTLPSDSELLRSQSLSNSNTSEASSNSITSEYYSEMKRLETFRRLWRPEYAVKPEDLARDGFIYVGPADRVRCVFCTKTLQQWEVGDHVETEHRKHYPNCPFVRGQCHQMNVPIGSVEGMNKTMGIKIRSKVNGCAFPNMGDTYERMKTFEFWPFQETVSKERLVDAGLFFTGSRDVVKCFSCGKQLRGWEPGDDPLFEHQKFYPQCSYIKEKMRSLNGAHSSKLPSSGPHPTATPPQKVQGHISETNSARSSGPSGFMNNHAPLHGGSDKENLKSGEQPMEEANPELSEPTFDKDRELSSRGAQAVLQNDIMSVEDLIPILRSLRLRKGPDEEIKGEEIMNFSQENGE